MNLRTVRANMLSQRRALDPCRIKAASNSISRRLWRLGAMARCQRIAGYFSVDGEIDCTEIFAEAWARRREIFLPILMSESLRFGAYLPNGKLRANRFKIPEPVATQARTLDARNLNVVLTPLVAFDSFGNRLGMGGGYYDRSLAFLKQRNAWQRPFLVGLAYEFQKIPAINARAWDIPLHAVVTEKQVYEF